MLAHPDQTGTRAPGLDLVVTSPRTATTRPWFAIGGIDEQRLREVIAAGASRIVVVRAITAAEDPRAAAAALRAGLADTR